MTSVSRPSVIQQLCSLRTHDSNTSKDDVIFNIDRSSRLGLKHGNLALIIAVKEGTAVRDLEKTNGIKSNSTPSSRSKVTDSPASEPKIETYDENGHLVPNGKEGDSQKSYVFMLKPMPEDSQKDTGWTVSLSTTIANLFGFRNRMQVLIMKVDEETHTASHVEITFRDQYLSRADMWRLAVSELSLKTVYKDQRLEFLDTIKATVNTVYINGKKRRSGFFSSDTRPIFRSESARFILFIQMSKEMWEFDGKGGGEIMFNKVIHGFLPELFKSWININARHLVTIVLFSRVEYDEEGDHRHLSISDDGSEKTITRDFYRVVASDMASNDWVRILYQLKKEFRSFLRDITVQRSAVAQRDEEIGFLGSEDNPDYVIVGKPSSASKGNILEAINLASSQFARDYIDRDLVRTGISVVAITAGTGIFEVDYSLLKLTTDNLISSGIGIDLVCLAPMPLHSVPLFKYRNPRVVETEGLRRVPSHRSTENTPRQIDLLSKAGRRPPSFSEPQPGDWSYAMPHWVDVSFWTGTADEQAMQLKTQDRRLKRMQHQHAASRSFALRCVLYELEMMGFMENEMTNICISNLHENPLHPWHKLRHRIVGRPLADVDRGGIADLDREWMEEYDKDIFRPLDKRKGNEDALRRSMLGTSDPTVTDSEHVVGGEKDTDSIIAPSVTTTIRSGGTTRSGAPSYLEWNLRDQQKPRSTILRKGSFLSFTSAGTASPASAKANRQISFGTGASQVAAPREDFSVQPEVAVSRASQTPSAPSSLFQQFRAALSRSVAPPIAEELPVEELPKDLRPSKPIAIETPKAPPKHNRTHSDEVAGSVDTVKANQPFPLKNSLPKYMRNEEPSAIFYAASRPKDGGHKPLLSTSGDVAPIPQTLSPVSALAPWLVLVNPSNPRKNEYGINNHFSRWQHVFPKPLKVQTMKWKSLSYPASVPLTNDFFPTKAQLADEYQESVYNISQNIDDELWEIPKTREALVRELIAFRLAQGFQLVVGHSVSDFANPQSPDFVNIFDPNYMSRDGDMVFMSSGTQIHQLHCLAGAEVEIRRFKRKPPAEIEMDDKIDNLPYRPYIRTILATMYEPRTLTFKSSQPEHNWNFIDSFIAGYHEAFSDNLRFWRARFVFIPVDIPPHGRRAGDSEEEIRLEGIRKLTQEWQKHRVVPMEERQAFQSRDKRKDPNPLMIEYQTRDPSAVIAAGLDELLLTEREPLASGLGLFSETETYSTKNIDLAKLARDLQGEHGIKVMDRWWHLRQYPGCFVGFDFTNWLIDRFRDIDTRDDAITFGNELMEQGLFQHVQRKHQFRDGQFFYTLASQYRLHRPESRASWFGTRRDKGSVPPTPLSELPKPSPTTESTIPRPATSSSSEFSDEKTSKSSEPVRRKEVRLSNVMRYNVGARVKQAYRPEVINLHYDRLHSPDNCYHFRIDWMNVTAKLIEDSVVHWATTARNYGLKLVELPIAEAAAITDYHPFRSPYMVKPAFVPPKDSHPEMFSMSSLQLQPQPPTDRFAFQKAVLNKMDFVLDMESASSFPSDINVTYSWGKNDYRFTQYIHRTGRTLAQITDHGNFFLLANRLYNDRSVTRDSIRPNTGHDHQHPHPLHNRHSAVTPDPRFRSPVSSPLARPVTLSMMEDNTVIPKAKNLDAEEIKDEFEAFCHNEAALKALYEDLMKPQPAPSPQVVPVPDFMVPALRLPANVSAMTASGRESSPSPVSAGTGKS
jgi:hypothetical protein